jgi:hypothetical protein
VLQLQAVRHKTTQILNCTLLHIKVFMMKWHGFSLKVLI